MATTVTRMTSVAGPRTASPWSRRWSAWGAPVAGVWSLAYGALGLYWALGGVGFPFGATHAESWMSPIAGVPPTSGGLVIALLGLIGAIAALAMSRAAGAGLIRSALIGFGWAMTLTLLLLVPDGRFLALVGYLPALIFSLGFDPIDWPMLNQGVCLAGGFAWGAATLVYQRRSNEARGRTGATSDAGRMPRWGTWATIAAVLLPLPYAATRLAWALGYPLGVTDPVDAAWVTDPALRASELSLGGMAAGGAVLTLGLIQRWGEVFPGWVPLLAGRRVPPALAIIPASIASAVLVSGGLGLWRMVLATGIDSPGTVVMIIPGLAFFPWGVALGLATLAYYERRRTQHATQGRLDAQEPDGRRHQSECPDHSAGRSEVR